MSEELQTNNDKTSAKVERYLEFDLGQESYAVHLLSVKEVIPKPETTPLPNAPNYFVGIMNLRGLIVSVVDLRKKLNIKSKVERLEEAVVIIEFQGISIGLIVDSINKVLNIPINEIVEIPEVQTQVNAQYIQGVYKGKDNLIIILDLEGILNIKEIQKHQHK